jgi:uncharacterized metal-binding protein YceD (DUF177 family)
MSAITFNVRHLEAKPLHLEGELAPEDLGLEQADELVHPAGPLRYDLELEKIEKGILVQGKITLPLKCECARCLKPFQHQLSFSDWACHLPLEGEDAVKLDNDVVDLTPYIREDTLLAFPQHPLCEPECKGLPNPWKGADNAEQTGSNPSTWSELNKLKF